MEEFYERSGVSGWAESAEDLADLMQRAARRGRLTLGTMRKLRAVLDEVLAKVTSIVAD